MKRGFTLIELLAVIVILAIIALITIPVILKMIDNAKENSYRRSIDLYGKAISSAIVAYESDQVDKKQPFNLTLDIIEKYIDYTGNDVDCNIKEIYKDKTIFLSGCNVNGIPVKDSKGYEGWYYYTNLRENIMAKKYVEAIDILFSENKITNSCTIQTSGELLCGNGNVYKINSKMDLPTSGDIDIVDGKVINYKNLTFDSMLVSSNGNEEKVEYNIDSISDSSDEIPTSQSNNVSQDNSNNDDINNSNTNNDNINNGDTNNSNTSNDNINNGDTNNSNTNNSNTNNSNTNNDDINNSNTDNESDILKDYVIIDYLETTGTQFINLGISPEAKMSYKIKVVPTQLKGWQALFSTSRYHNSIPQFSVDIHTPSTCPYWNYGSDADISCDNKVLINKEYTIEVYLKESGNKIYFNNKLVFSNNWSNSLPDTDLFLLAKNYGDNKTGNEFFIGKLYYFKIYKNDILYMDMIPVYRKTDRVVGMYDRVGKKFYMNKGSGTFRMPS